MWLSGTWLVIGLIAITCQLSVNGQQNSPPGGYYTTRYDHIDIEHILNQKRLVHYYSECLLDRGPCTPQGIEFKRILPEALRTNCLRCTEKQRFVTIKSIKRLKKEYPEVWAELATIWDPTGDYVRQLEESYNKKYNRTPEILQPSPTVQVQSVPVPEPVPSVPVPVPQETSILANRFGFEPDNVVNVPVTVPNIGETLSSPKPETQANTIANKPISFSTTQPITTKLIPSTSFTTTTKKILTTILQEKLATSTHRISYNYDFAATIKPIQQIPVNPGINMVIRGVNNIIQPITDIAGRVITAGTDIAGIVLNALGVRKTY